MTYIQKGRLSCWNRHKVLHHYFFLKWMEAIEFLPKIENFALTFPSCLHHFQVMLKPNQGYQVFLTIFPTKSLPYHPAEWWLRGEGWERGTLIMGYGTPSRQSEVKFKRRAHNHIFNYLEYIKIWFGEEKLAGIILSKESWKNASQMQLYNGRDLNFTS